MPGHFLVKLEGETPPQFVDCFNGGTILREQDCEQFITASGLDYYPQLLEQSSTPTILARMLRNLKQIHLQRSDVDSAIACMDRILLLAPDSPLELRELLLDPTADCPLRDA